MPLQKQAEIASDNQDVIKFIIDTTAFDVHSDFEKYFLRLLSDHIDNKKIKTVDEVRTLLKGFLVDCDEAEFPSEFSKKVAFGEKDMNRALVRSEISFFDTIENLKTLSDGILEELEQFSESSEV